MTPPPLSRSIRLAVFMLTAMWSFASEKDLVRQRVIEDIEQGRPVVIHAVVALCDNQHQGVVPVPASLGNGQDPQSNLYWGAAYGLSTFLKKRAGYRQVQRIPLPLDGVLERLVLHRHIAAGEVNASVFVVAEAWDGRRMQAALTRFFHLAAGKQPETLTVTLDSTDIQLRARAKITPSFGRRCIDVAFISRRLRTAVCALLAILATSRLDGLHATNLFLRGP